MKLTVQRSPLINGFVYPISESRLSNIFERILINSNLELCFLCVENTSDILIARSPWDYPLTNWTLYILAVKKEYLRQAHQVIVEEALPILKDWFISSQIAMVDEPRVWQCFSITMRMENEKLLVQPVKSVRPYPRPDPG